MSLIASSAFPGAPGVRRGSSAESARQQLKDLCARCEDIATTTRLARGFATVLRRRDGHRRTEWLDQAEQSEIKDLHVFANGLRKEHAAVTLGLTVPWSSGAVEGHVNRIQDTQAPALRQCRVRSPQAPCSPRQLTGFTERAEEPQFGLEQFSVKRTGSTTSTR
uniref:transposase n=1 Tax=Streptomyces lomondensis TaxID=68229 RepID=UPI0016776675